VRVEARRAEIGNRLACLADVLLHALAHPDELPSLRRRGELRIVGHRVELQGDADEALQQRVVQFAAQARTLSDEQCELLAHAPHVQAPRCRDRCGNAEHGQREEPGGLVEHRSDRQWQRGYGGTRPAALGIRRHDRERVIARRQVRVESLAARPGVDPFAVEAFQLVAEVLPKGRGQVERGVLHFEPVRAGGQRQRRPRRDRQPDAVGAYSFDAHGMRQFFVREIRRIDDGEAAPCDEPQAAVIGSNRAAVPAVDEWQSRRDHRRDRRA
jgi:hypothetical protein